MCVLLLSLQCVSFVSEWTAEFTDFSEQVYLQVEDETIKLARPLLEGCSTPPLGFYYYGAT